MVRRSAEYIQESNCNQLPVQLTPFPLNPALQVQVKEPGVLVHVACS